MSVTERLRKLARNNLVKQLCMACLAIAVTVILIAAMTVAWYNNVIHTEDLVFETGAWDFDFEGFLSIGSKHESVNPGDSGVVYFELKNSSAEAINVEVTVTKNTDGASDEMKKRMYFYIDRAQLINGEYVEGIYVNDSESYAYKLRPASDLVLTEEYQSDAYLKWEWVYDLLGYYVKGTMSGESFEAIDYMRPVEYDLNAATFSEEGELLTVDGTTTKEAYISKLLRTDGIQGNAVPEPVNGYYPIAVDETTNTGIWLYLYNEEEIARAAAWDTAIADSAADGKPLSFEPKLLLTGQQVADATVLANNEKEIEEVIANSGVDCITLSGDIALTQGLSISDERKLTIDLDGNTLTIPDDASIALTEGSALTLLNGTIQGSAKAPAVKSTGAEVTLVGVKMTGAKRAVEITDDVGTGVDSYVKLTDCELQTSDVSVRILGNGTKSKTRTRVQIVRTTLDSGYAAVVTSGNAPAAGVDIDILDSSLTGKWAAIYQTSTDTICAIRGSMLTGYTALVQKAGEVTVENCHIIGTGAKGNPAFSNSGWTDTGDGIYIETNYNADIKLTVRGDETLVESTYGYAFQVYEEQATNVDVNLIGGRYDSDISRFVKSGYLAVIQEDGTYKVEQGEREEEESEE